MDSIGLETAHNLRMFARWSEKLLLLVKCESHS
jgi:hypothetical protein